MKKRGLLTRFPLFILMILLMCSGCNQADIDKQTNVVDTMATDTGVAAGPVTLRVLVEEEQSEHFERLIYWVRNAFENEHESVDIVIEELPTEWNADERELALTQLRTEIMAGGGPDIYLLPTKEINDGNYFNIGNKLSTPLFPNVNQAMRNGIFADISSFYDNDTALNKEDLVTSVMDAGVVDRGRYVLPLRYTYGVAYVNLDQLTAMGLTADEVFFSGAIGMMDTVSNAGLFAAYNISNCFSNIAMSCLPAAIDYDKQKVLLTQADLVAFLGSYRSFKACEIQDINDANSYAEYGTNWATSAGQMHVVNGPDKPAVGACCMKIESLETVIDQTRLAKAAGINMAAIPITSPDGTLTADVTFFGAVGAGCEHPELAYEFISMFLSEEVQWETPIHYRDIFGFSADGYPVRTKGSVLAIDQNVWRLSDSVKKDDENKQRRYEALAEVELTDADVPILQEKIDKALFPNPLENTLIDILIYQITAETTDEEIQAIARDWLRELEFHLSES